MSTSYSVTVTGRVYEQPDNQPNSELGSGTISLTDNGDGTANVALSITAGKIAGFNESAPAAFTSGIPNSTPEDWRVINVYQYTNLTVNHAASSLSYLLLLESTTTPSSAGLNAISGYIFFVNNYYIYTAKIESIF